MPPRIVKFTLGRKNAYLGHRFKIKGIRDAIVKCNFCPEELVIGELIVVKPSLRLAKLYHLECGKKCNVI